MSKESTNNSTGGSSKKGVRAKKEVIELDIPAVPPPPTPTTDDSVSSSNASATEEMMQDDMPTFASEIASTLEQLTSIREATVTAIAALKKLEKRHNKEVKNARKRQKKTTPTTEGNARPNCIFKRPIPLDENLARMLNKMPGHSMCPTEITHLVNVYIDEHNLKNGNKKIIVDKMLSACIGDEEGSAISYKELQRGLFRIIKQIIEGLVA